MASLEQLIQTIRDNLRLFDAAQSAEQFIKWNQALLELQKRKREYERVEELLVEVDLANRLFSLNVELIGKYEEV